MKTPFFSYLRVSGKGQIGGDGFPRQRETIARYADSHNLELAREFVEAGVSGTKEAFDREALTDLLVAIKSNGVRLVLVENANRLARDLMVSEILLAEFRKLGVKVIAADSDTDLTVEDNDPHRKMIRQLFGVLAEYEKSLIVQKLRVARLRRKKETGHCEGRKPYGSRPQDQAGIRRAIELRNQGYSMARITETLNAEGVPAQTPGAKWHPTSVRRLLARIGQAE